MKELSQEEIVMLGKQRTSLATSGRGGGRYIRQLSSHQHIATKCEFPERRLIYECVQTYDQN